MILIRKRDMSFDLLAFIIIIDLIFYLEVMVHADTRTIIRNLGTNLERERFKLGYSQQDMAKALDMSLSSYKRLANGDTGKVDVYTVYKLSQLTGKMFYELCGESSDLFQTYDRMRNLSPTQLHFIESLVQFEFDFARNLETVPSVSREDYTTMIIPSGNMHDGMVYDSCSLEKSIFPDTANAMETRLIVHFLSQVIICLLSIMQTIFY